jgi:acyl-coenzyme A synthetase/AMP-(fatty) acid ligase
MSKDSAEDPYSKFISISSILKDRATKDSKMDIAFTWSDSRLKNNDYVTYENLHLNAVRYATYFIERAQCKPGSSVALLFRSNEHLEFLGAFFGCLYAGLVAVPIATHSFHSGDEFLEMFFVISHSKSTAAVVADSLNKGIQKALAKKDLNPPQVQWIKSSEISTYRRTEELDVSFEPMVGDIAYLEYTKNSSGDLKGIVMSHKVVMKQCGILKNSQCITSEDLLLTCMEFRHGLGLLFGIFLGVFSGMQTVTVPSDICQIPGLWLIAMTRFKATIGLTQSVDLLGIVSSLGKFVPKKENVDLSRIKALFMDTISPDAEFLSDVAEYMIPFGLTGSNVITPIIGLHEFGGVAVSIFPNFSAPKSYKLKTVVLDAKKAMESKVSVISITDDMNTLSASDTTPGLMRISDSGRVIRQGISCFI